MSLKKDISGSIVAMLVTLPQAVAYGLIAVAPMGPEWAYLGIACSLGSAVLFGMLSAAFTSNMFLVSGPRALSALVIATSIQEGLSRGLTTEVALLFGFLSVIIAGIFQLFGGLARLGHLLSHVPVPVINGFINASALIVFVSSIPMILGLPDLSLVEIALDHTQNINGWALCVAGLTIVTIFLTEGRWHILPSALSGLIIGTILYHIGTNLFQMPVGPVVGVISFDVIAKVPMLMSVDFSFDLLKQNMDIPLLAGLSIGLLVSFDTVLTSSALDDKTNQRTRANYDLRVHGFINILMGALGFLPGSGTLSRSFALINGGAQTRGANIGVGFVFVITFAVLAPMVALLPLWVTSGMLMATAFMAFDHTTLEKMRGIVTKKVAYPRVLAGDVLVTLTVVATALAFDMIAAVGVGIVLAIALFVFGMGRDPVRRTYTCTNFRSKLQRSDAQMACLTKEGHRVAVIELQGALFFGACNRLQACADELFARGVEYLLLDLRHLTSIDSTGSAMLRRLHLKCAENGGALLMTCLEQERRYNLKGQPIDGEQKRVQASIPRWIWLNLQANGVIKTIGCDYIFDDTDSAIAAVEEIILQQRGQGVKGEYLGRIMGSALFRHLTRQQVTDLAGYVTKERFECDEIVFQQDDDGDRAFFLVSGRMDVLIDIPGSSRKKRVSVFSDGTLFGEMGLIDGAPRSATVKALEPSICFSIDRKAFNHLQQTSPTVALVLMKNISRLFAGRLRIANHMISELEQ